MFETLRNRFALPQGWQPYQFFKPKVILSFVGLILAAASLIWLFDKIFIYFYARSYVEELAATLALNKHLATALVWAVFALTVFLFSCLISFSKRRRSLGLAGLLVLVIGQALVLYWADKPFDAKGVAQKCYVMTRDSIRFGERAGIDPNTGLECKPLTPEIAERVGRYAKGDRPKRLVASDNPVFFAPGTGSPIVWYSREQNGFVEIFDLMGYHPQTGEELTPIAKDIVSVWNDQNRQAPERIYPDDDYAFFNPVTGQPNAWHRKTETGDYEFYNRPGFYPRTGEPLIVVDLATIAAWKKYREAHTGTPCYVLTKDSVRYGTQPGIDAETGRQCRLFSAEMLARLKEYEKGNRPKRIDVSEPIFFDLRSGEPAIWYAKNKNGNIELFSLMGFHPDTGDELLPVTKEVVASWKDQQSKPKRVSQKVDPETFVFFDQITGEPRAWHWRGSDGQYEFYDGPGFHPGTGEPLIVVDLATIAEWKKYREAHTGRPCYVLTKVSVRYGTQPGIDAETGRQCRPFSVEMLARLKEYEKGDRPKRIDISEPTFFDLRSGEPAIWYAKNKNGNIELFSLMGFHPDTGEELLPVTKEVVASWKDQQAKPKRVPQKVDPKTFIFFDQITGEPRAWYWRGSDGQYEFYDGPGFHPATGDPLAVLTKDLVVKLQKEAADQAKKQADAEAAAKKNEEAAANKRREELDKLTQSEQRCDLLAANPNDQNRVGEGVPYDALKLQAKDAVEACEIASKQDPSKARLQYQLARALQFSDRKRAFALLQKLVSARYPAAFDNIGWIVLAANPPEAVNYFRTGVDLGDSNSMVSLAEMIDRNHASPRGPRETKLALYHRAAQLGNKTAANAEQVELQKLGQAEANRDLQMQQAKIAGEVFNIILHGIQLR